MADYRNPLMPPEEVKTDPIGGLAPESSGGLSKFMGDVGRGIKAVMSHPVYEHLWSGMVSASAGDPMAGPMAVQQLKQNWLNQDQQKQEMDFNQKAATNAEHNALLRDRDMQRLRAALATGDPRNVQDAYADFNPGKAAEMVLAPPSSAKPQLDWEYAPDGKRRRVQVKPDGTTAPLSSAQWVPVQPPMQINMPGQDYARGGDLRKEWNDNVVKPTKVGTDAMRRVIEGAGRETPAGDIALIFGFMKIQDPGSTVREGEFATAENAASIPERIRVAYNKALKGDKLTPEQRADFLGTAQAQFEANYRRPYIENEKFYRGVVERSGLSPDDVMFDALSEFRDSVGSAPKRPGPGSKPTVVEGAAARSLGLK